MGGAHRPNKGEIKKRIWPYRYKPRSKEFMDWMRQADRCPYCTIILALAKEHDCQKSPVSIAELGGNSYGFSEQV